MHIVHVVRQFHPAVGGLEGVVDSLSAEQVANGHRVRVVTLDRLFNAPDASRPRRHEQRNGVDIVRIPFLGSKRYPIAFSVIRHIRDADIVHVHGVDFFCDYLAWTALLHRRKLVLSTHGGFFHTDFATRLVGELSGGERKRLVLELLLSSNADVLLLDEPDNYLDIPTRAWLEEQIRQCRSTILMVSHDRTLLERVSTKIVVIEGSGCWVHGGSYATFGEARQKRQEQLGDELKRWNDEERRLFQHMKIMKQRAAQNFKNATKANAAETRWEKFVAAGPPPPPVPDQHIYVNLRGHHKHSEYMIRWGRIPGLDPTSREILSSVFRKAEFWRANAAVSLNDRQRDILNRLLDGFQGKLTSSKWAKLAKCSQDTALRDIDDLLKRDILVKDAGGGRSTSYALREL